MGSLGFEGGLQRELGKSWRQGFCPDLSGTDSAILNRESSDSESCDSNRAIPRLLQALIGCNLDGDSESIFRGST